MAEFGRALKTLKALQAEQAAAMGVHVAAPAPVPAQPPGPAARPKIAPRPGPSEPERRRESPPERRLEYVLPDRPLPGHALHEPAAAWLPDEPEAGQRVRSAPAPRGLMPNEPGQAPRRMALPRNGR